MKRIAIFCGSKEGNPPQLYRSLSAELTKGLYDCGLSIVYGGASIGLMGMIATDFLKLGGEVVGVLPKHIAQKEIAKEGLTQMHIVETMHERKELMYNLADYFLILPGGLGTMDEYFEILTWSQLELHKKPIYLLNYNGFYGTLIHFFSRLVQEGFLSEQHSKITQVKENCIELFEEFKGLKD